MIEFVEVMETEMYNFIKENIVIDFPVPEKLQEVFKEAEDFDRQNNFEYFCVADEIDVMCKAYVGMGKLTHRQWDLICYKYSVNGKLD